MPSHEAPLSISMSAHTTIASSHHLTSGALRLTTLLHARTIAREDGAHLLSGKLAKPDLRKACTATHPTRPTPPEGASEPLTSLLTCLSCHACAKNRTLRHQAELDKPPKGSRQLARKRDDHDLSHTLALPGSALQEPTRQCTLRLVPNPQPDGLNHNGAHAPTSGSRDALASLLLTTLKGAWREAKKTSDLSLVIKVPVIDFTREQGGVRRAYALQLQQQMALLLGFLACCRRRITFFFNRINLLLHRRKPLHLAGNFGG